MMYEMLKDEIDQFEKIKSNSAFCRLTLKKKKLDWSTSKVPLAFQFFRNNTLDKLDNILKQFEIEEKARKDFKKRFEDKAFLEGKDQFKHYKIIWSNMAELLSANFVVANNNERIKDLSAWNSDCKSDMISEKNSIVLFTEVKYLGQIPELINQIRNIIKNRNRPGAVAISGPEHIYGYINMRIADAVFQLEKNKICQEKRRVFFIMEKSPFTNNVMTLLRNKKDWNRQVLAPLIKVLKISQEKAKRYRQESVKSLHEKTNILTICSLDDKFDLITENITNQCSEL